MIRVCVICDKIFGEKEPYEDKSYTHGYCPECYEKEMLRLKKQMREMGIRTEENPKDPFLQLHEIEVEQYPEGWNAYRFGILIARGFPSKRRLIEYLKTYFRKGKYLGKNPKKDFYLKPGIRVIRRTQLSSVPQWIYVEDVFGNLLAKEKISPRKAFDILQASARVVSLKEKGENFIVFKVYTR